MQIMTSNSPNSSSSVVNIVTDYDYIISLGYKQDDVSRVLKLTNGDRNAAIYILDKEYYTNIENNRQYIKNKQLREYSSWRKEMPDDWMDHVGKYNQPNIAINRALHKTPIYLQIESYERDLKQNCNYLVDIILKDGRHWKMIRRYSDFCRLKESLPLGTCSKFTNRFPYYAIFSLVITKMSDEFVDRRIILLNEWIRELVLNEECMINDKIVESLYNFIHIDKHGGKIDLNNTIVLKLNSDNRESFSKYNKELERKNVYFNNLKEIKFNNLPLPLDTIRQVLPFKFNTNSLPSITSKHYKNTTSTRSTSNNSNVSMENSKLVLPIFNMHQLNKDYSRDRLIIQGNRIQGSHSDLETILKVSEQTIEELMLIAKKSLRYSPIIIPPPPPPPPPICDKVVVITPHTINTKHNTTNNNNIRSPKNPFDDDFIDNNDLNYIKNMIIDESEVIVPLSSSSPIPTTHTTEVEVADTSSSIAALQNQNDHHDVDRIARLGLHTIHEISLYALHLASRTESAFTSYSSLTQIVDLANTRQVTNFIPFLITPESDLANSLHINYSLINRNQQWCIECQIEGSTVYRFVDDVDMKPLLQLQATYVAKFICIPMMYINCSNSSCSIGIDNSSNDATISNNYNNNNTFTIIEGSRSLVIEQSTTSTAHDWDSNNH